MLEHWIWARKIVVPLYPNRQQYISLVCTVDNENTSQDGTELNDRDEQVTGVSRQLQMGLRYTP